MKVKHNSIEADNEDLCSLADQTWHNRLLSVQDAKRLARYIEEQTAGEGDTYAKAMASLILARLLTKDDRQACETHLATVETLLAQKPNSTLYARYLLCRGTYCYYYTTHDEAMRVYQDAVTQAEAVPLPEEAGYALIGVANIHRQRGEFGTAVILYQRARDIGQAVRNYDLEARAENNIGLLYFTLDAYDAALEQYQTVVRIAEDNNFTSLQAMSYNNLGTVHLRMFNYDTAEIYFKNLYL